MSEPITLNDESKLRLTERQRFLRRIERGLRAVHMREVEGKTFRAIGKALETDHNVARYLYDVGLREQDRRRRAAASKAHVEALPANVLLKAIPGVAVLRWHENWTPEDQERELRKERRRG